MSFRNQSPPPEYEESNNDKIGTSCYSELWLYKLLMDLLRFVCENKNSQEVEKKIEEDLCTLWDMTVDKELIKDLRQFDLIEVFSKVLVENNFSRLTEIIFGILANLASDNEMCREISENEELTWIILGSLNDRDIPVLNETCRVIHTVIASEEHRKNWTQKIHFQENVHDNLIFILRSSLNVALLKNSLHLTDALITEDDSLAEIWCDLPLLNAIIEADKQLRKSNETCYFEIFLRTLYTFSSTNNGLKAILLLKEEITELMIKYLCVIFDEESKSYFIKLHHNSLRALVPIIDVLIASSEPEEALHILNEVVISENQFKGDEEGVIEATTEKSVFFCLLDIGLACEQMTEQLSDTLDPLNYQREKDGILGIWSDLRTLLKDCIDTIESLIESHIDLNQSPSLSWLKELNKSRPSYAKYRQIFIECLLGKDISALYRKRLIDMTTELGLTNILETLTEP